MKSILSDLEKIILPVAKEVLLPRFALSTRQFKADGSIVTEADMIMQDRLRQQLSDRWPQIPLLGEEMSETEQEECLRNSQAGVWLLDPLDGTSNFAAGVPCFAVSLALLQNGEIQCGLVYDPLRDECFTALKGQGAWLNDEHLSCVSSTLPLKNCIALIDFKRLPHSIAQFLVSTPPYGSQRSFGSGVLDWCWLAAGRVHVYLHGQQKLWDIAAGSLILAEAGGCALTLEKQPVFNASLQSRSIVAASDAALFKTWSECLCKI